VPTSYSPNIISYLYLTTSFFLLQVKLNTRLKYSLTHNNDSVYFIGNTTMHPPGGGQPIEWSDLEEFIDQKVHYYWECGALITLQLHSAYN
jgi:hypothetical protein